MIKIIFEVYMRVALLFLTWYGLVIVWILPMYYKSFRSRVMFEKTLWKKVSSFFNDDLICNRMLNQKKFLDLNLNLIYLKTKQNLSIIDLDKEFNFIKLKKKREFFNSEVNINFFENFKGCIFICDYLYMNNDDNKEHYDTFVFFYNVLTSQFEYFILNSKFINILILNIVNIYLEDDMNFIELKNIIFLLDNFVDQINKKNKIFVYKNERGFIFDQCFTNKTSFINFLINF